MKIIRKAKDRILPYISLFSIVLNTLQPFALAGALTLFPSPVLAEESALGELIDESPSPTESPTATDNPIESPTPTPEPTSSGDPSPSPTTSPSPSPSPTISASPAPYLTPTPTPETTEDPTLNTETTEATESSTTLPEPDLTESQEETSATLNETLTTDKADYAPTDTVVISGTDFLPSTEYRIVITSVDNYIYEDRVKSDESGALFYTFQLDGTYRPDYLVEIYLGDTFVISTTFTDTHAVSPANNQFEKLQGLLFGGDVTLQTDWTTGNVCAGARPAPGCYSDGEEVPHKATLQGLENGVTYELDVQHDYKDSPGGLIGYENFNDFTAVSGINGGITVGTPVVSAGESTITYHISFESTGGDAEIHWDALLGLTAHNWNGASLHVRVLGYGNKEVPVPVNELIPLGNIVIRKVTDPAIDTTTEFTYSGDLGNFTLNGGSENSFSDLDAGVYTVTETNPAGWELSSIVCEGDTDDGSVIYGNSIDIDLDDNELITCTFTNTLSRGSITIDKITDPTGSDQVFEFNLTGDYTGYTTLTDQSEPYTFSNLLPGSYSLTETEVTGWTLDSATCTDSQQSQIDPSSINLQPGQDITCTFYNSLDTGTIRVEKQTLPDGDLTEFVFTGDLSGNLSDGEYLELTKPVGTYSATETTPPAGWELSSITCNDNDSTGDLQSSTATFNLQKDETITCTFTNEKAPTLEVVKKLLPSDDPGLFNLLIDDNQLATDVGGSGTTGVQTLDIGLHTVSETAGTQTDLSDYNTTYSENCAGGEITLDWGDEEICTITNTRKIGEITFIKRVIGGDAEATDWEFEVLNVGTFQNGTYTFNTGTYSVTETSSVLGYTATGVDGVCTNLSGETATLTVTEDGGECIFINTRDTGSLTVNKFVDTDGDGVYDSGNTIANSLGFSWKLDTDDWRSMGTTVSSVTTTVGSTTHSITENSVEEYTFEGWFEGEGSCSDPDGSTLPISVNIQKDTETVITFCNARKTGTVVVHKDVQGPTGQDIVDTNGSFVVELDNANPQQITDNETATYFNVPTGNHTVTEPVIQGGYSLYSITPSNFELSYGETKHVYVVNRQDRGNLVLVKNVINDDGGDAFASDFPVYIDTVAASWGSNPVTPGNHYVNETSLTGYTPSVWSGACDAQGNVYVGPGETKTCYITNDDVAPTITLIKQVLGGDANSNNFGLTIGGTPVFSGQTLAVRANTPIELNEAGLPGYSFTSLTGDEKCPSELGGTATLNEAENITCTITNTRDTGTISGYKFEDLDGDGLDREVGEPGLSGWTINLYRNDQIIYFDVTDGNGYFEFENLPTNTYKLCEAPQNNWIQTYPGVCHEFELTTDGIVRNFGNFQEGHISGHKYNDLDGDGTWDAGEPAIQGWTIKLDRPEGDDLTRTTNSSGYYYFGDLGPGEYTAYELDQQGWTQTAPVGDVFNIFMTSNGSYPDNDFGNVYLSDLHGRKWHDENLNGVIDDEDLLSGWIINLYKHNGEDYTLLDSTLTDSGDHYGWYWFEDLLPGDYMICEDLETGWQQTYPNSLADPDCHYVTLPIGESGQLPGLQLENYVLGPSYDFGNVKLGSITVEKTTDPAESLQLFTFNLSGDATGSAILMDGESETFNNLLPGTYYLEEEQVEGWDLTYAVCSDEGSADFEPIQDGFQLPAGIDIFCTFENTQRGDVEVTKYNDLNGNGVRDEGEEALSGWEINLTYKDSTQSAVTDESGNVSFTNLLPNKDYLVSETSQEGWDQTGITCDNQPSDLGFLDRQITLLDLLQPSNFAHVLPGETTYCEIGNQQEPELTIKKSNNATESLSPGASVEFTITLELTGSSLFGVEVYDLPPTGFTYRPGSYSATKNGSPLAISEPTYASPGKWLIGGMDSGDIVTLTYTADISTDQDPGTYDDLAWGFGYKRNESKLLAEGIDSPYIEGNFVGTSVEVQINNREEGSADIEGEVLGASTTRLPATGANSIWVLIASLFMLLGASFMFIGKNMKKSTKFLSIITAAVILSFSAPSAHAVDDPSLSVRVEQPSSPTRFNEWNLSYTVLDLENRAPEVKCYVKSPGETFTQFDSTITLGNGGDNGYCELDSSIIDEQGTYEFYVTANSGSGIESSDTVSVEYRTDNPGTPHSYSKEHPSMCRWIIKFHTANDDGKTTRVEIYSSTEKSFSFDSGTRVGTVGIGSDEEGEFIHDRADNCDEEWYYVIRALDDAGNASPHIGDEVIVTVNPTEEEEESGAITVIEGTGTGGRILGAEEETGDSAMDGDILGEEDETIESGEGLISTASDAIKDALKGPNKWWTILAILVAALLGYGFYSRYKSRQK